MGAGLCGGPTGYGDGAGPGIGASGGPSGSCGPAGGMTGTVAQKTVSMFPDLNIIAL